MTNGRRPSGARLLIWTLISAAVFVCVPVALLAMLAVAPNFGVPIFFAPHFLVQAAWVLGSGLLILLGVQVAGRAILGKSFRASTTVWTVATVGVGLATLVQAALHIRLILRFGYADGDFAQVTWLLFAVVLAVATGAFGVLSAPRGGRLWPAIPAISAAITVLVIAVPDARAAVDGIPTDTWPLAIAMSAAVAYAIAVIAMAVRLVMREASA